MSGTCRLITVGKQHGSKSACPAPPVTAARPLADHLPAGTAFRAATARRGQCTALRAGARGATETCHLATLKAGAARRTHITVTVKASTGTPPGPG